MDPLRQDLQSAVRCAFFRSGGNSVEAVAASVGISEATTRELLLESLERLSARQRLIVTARYGLDGGPKSSVATVAAQHGLSRELVREIESRALAQLIPRTPGVRYWMN
jgi:DNA-directed RNA polymerase sigma subunit (sigma70/sigma32)